MLLSLAALAALAQAAPAASASAAPHEAIEADWRTIPDDEVLVMTLAGGRQVVIRLAPRFAPVHIANIRRLALARWWDGTSINRVQDNYVVQWGDATEKKPLPPGVDPAPPAEYSFTAPAVVAPLMRADPYARSAGFSSDGWPVVRGAWAGDVPGTAWMPHCYGYVGVGRNLAPDTGTGAELYAVIGHAPRHLERNIALVGRVIEGMEHLSSLPRGTGELGFYVRAEERVPIVSARLASSLPPAERPRFQYRATDNPRFSAYVRMRENRTPPFFNVPAGGADICNVPVPVRRLP